MPHTRLLSGLECSPSACVMGHLLLWGGVPPGLLAASFPPLHGQAQTRMLVVQPPAGQRAPTASRAEGPNETAMGTSEGGERSPHTEQVWATERYTEARRVHGSCYPATEAGQGGEAGEMPWYVEDGELRRKAFHTVRQGEQFAGS